MAPARIRSARAGLIPGTLARSRAGSSASRAISSSSASRSTTIPWTPIDGSPAARWAAAARLRTVPPRPDQATASPAPSPSSQLASDSSAATWRRSSSSCLRFGGAVDREVALAHQHGADPPGAALAGQPVLDPQQLQRAAAEIEHAALLAGSWS